MFNCLILITGISQSALSQEYTQGEMTFSVRTVTYNGDRSPRHVLVLWVEDSNGFVKTRELNGNRRKEWLLTWRASSKYNVVDATTGATLNSHTSHTVKWDCRDVTGNIVPNGDYSVYVEFTEEHAQGPLFKIDFTKSNDSVTIKPPDQSYFKDMNLTFKPVFVSAGFRYSIDGLNVSFTNTSSGADSFSWDFGDGTSSTEENPIHTFALEGTYPVKLYAKKGLFQSIEEQEISVTNPATGISPFMTGASVYPNPFHESIMIKPEKGSVIEVINIYSLNAIHMHSSLITASGEFEVSLADLPSGLYILQLSSKGQTTCQFIIKD